MNLRSRLPASLTAFMALFFPLLPAPAAVTEAWVQRYSTMTGHSGDEAVKVVRDAAGDIIVAGNSDEATSGFDFLTIKYSGVNGAILWQRRFPGGMDERVKALAADASGNVVITGKTYFAGRGEDWYTAKYAAADGALVWEKYFHSGPIDEPQALALDGGGNVLVTGYSYDGTHHTVHTVKYAAVDGALRWQKSIGDALSGGGIRSAVAVDAGGNAAVATRAAIGTNEGGFPLYGCLTVKYAAADGTVFWQKGVASNGAPVIAMDAGGNVFTASARGYDEADNLFDCYLIKYAAADGARIWAKGIVNAETGGDDFLALALDSSGNVVLARPVVIPVPDHLSLTDYVTAKYAAANGALLWEKPFNSSAHSDLVRALSVEAGGNVTVTGTTSHFIAAQGYHNDFYTARYAATDGALVWEKQHHGGPGTSIDAARALAIMSNGDAVVTGTANGGSPFGNDFYTARFAAANGALVWEKRYDGPGANDEFAHAVAMDGDGNVIVAGYPATIKYRADGTIAWAKPGAAGALAVDGTGSVVVTGMGTIKYRADGTTAWSIPDAMKVMTLDAAGNVFHAGNTSDSLHPGHARAKYAAADGTLLWKINNGGATNDYFAATAAAVDAAGNLIVTGTAGSSFDGLNYYTAKYAGSNGALLWWQRFDGAAHGNDIATAVAVDGNGNVIVTGYSKNGWDDQFTYADSDYHTLKYAAADGALIWQKRYDSFDYGDDRANVVAVDAAGNVVVTGSSAEGDGEWYGPTASYTAKYAAADGVLIWEKRDYWGVASAMAVDPGGNVVISGVNGRIESYNYAAGTNFYTAKYAAADGSFIWRRNSPTPGAYHFMGYWDLLFPIPKGDGNSHSLALGPNGRVAITGSSDWNSGPDAVFDYETIVYQEVAGPVSFAAWAASLVPDSSGRGVADDPDHDGLANGVEFVLGENPMAPSSGGPAATLSGDIMLFTFSRDDASETADINVTVETSTDLITWPDNVLTWPNIFFIGQNTAVSSMGVTVAENGTAPDTITVAIPMGPGKAKFARLKVSIYAP